MLKSLQEAIGQVFAIRIRTKSHGTPWLDQLLSVTNLLMNSSDLLPFPYVKSCATLVVFILQTIRDVKKNQDDFRELLTNIVDVIKLVRDESLQSQCPSLSTDFRNQCTEFNNRLIDILESIHEHSRSTGAWRRYARSATIKDDIARHRRTLDEFRNNLMLSTVIQTHRGIEQILDGIERFPMLLGYTWEGSHAATILLTDILDVETPIPLILCQTWEIFRDVLLLLHRTRPGKRYIDKGDYDLTINDTEHVKSTTWNSVVKAGLRVKMSAVLRVDSTEDNRRCPSCSTLNTQTSLGSEILCQHCAITFRVSQGYLEEVVHSPEDHVIPSSHQVVGPEHDQADNDARYIRRFHVVLRIFKVVQEERKSFAETRVEEIANDPETSGNQLTLFGEDEYHQRAGTHGFMTSHQGPFTKLAFGVQKPHGGPPLACLSCRECKIACCPVDDENGNRTCK
ncbi:hypothetical protein C8J56DRAFT_1045284 [Mycena floridula]|nr:hypothetical protein C8J56DRAFT_1045284 [Mycena floridula]